MAEYGVKALASYSGVNAHTLRVWERRYGALKPRRSANGRRVYSQEDADRLCLLGELTAKGHAISALAKLSASALEELISTPKLSRTRVEDSSQAVVDAKAKVSSMLLDRMVVSLESFKLRELSSQLASARLHCSVSDFIYQIVMPMIGRIGILVNEEKLSIAHEHALSAILKTHIYQSIYHMGSTRDRSVESAGQAYPSIVIATQEGDYHEFGILISLLLAESRGLNTHFFGCNMPAKSLAGAANALRSAIVLIGRSIRMPLTTGLGNVVTQRDYLKELDQTLMASTVIWVGGVLEQNALKFRARHRLLHIPTIQELDERFKSLVNRDNDGGA